MSEFINHHTGDPENPEMHERGTMILAIDPGLTGALALYDPDLDFLHTEPLPVQWRIVNKKKKHELDLKAMFAWIAQRAAHITDVIVEQPAAMPGVGAVSQFNFGRTCGQCEALIIGMGFTTLSMVHPVKWKSALDVASDKRRSRARAAKLLPTHAKKFELARNEGEAEAAMLALYRHLVNTRMVMPTPEKVIPVKVAKVKVTNIDTRPGGGSQSKRPVGRPPKKKAA